MEISQNTNSGEPRSLGGEIPFSRKYYSGEHVKCGGEWTQYPDSSGNCECSCHHDETYRRAKNDWMSAIVLDALHTQDARTYNGSCGDIGKLALETADKIRQTLG